ncbi:MAG: acyl-CoA dehydrogenase family protein [Chloroflexi bacterium]|jgi:alkylation response protein AidB-like acyl-CoA dehydrogenase|nr:acyl-CoA dehydrogenase family protein [Chloroflexota bacterium]
MDFSFNEEQKMFQAMARDFAKREIEPLAAQWDEDEKFPYEVIKKMADVGLCAVGLPEEYGGSGDELSFVILSEEIAHASAGLAVIVFCNAGLAAYPITLHGTEDQKGRFIPRTVEGAISAFALTEATAGSDPAAIQTTYVQKDEGYVLSGTKTFITNGAEADWVITFATKDRALGYRGISAFIVEKGTPGFSVGKLERKTGIHPSSTAELIFDNCNVPKENLIGEEGRGFRISLEAIDASRVTVGAQALGIAQAALDAAVDYAKQREQFGQVIARFQAIQWMIADMATEIDAARLLTYRAAWLMTRQEPHLKEAAMAKLYASEVAHRVCHKAVQIFGGYGYTRDFAVERYARDQRITELYEGTSEMQRWTIARQVLGIK